MKVEGTVKSVKDQVKEWKKEGLSIGFVPTMGYLHEGHASLIKAAREGNDRVVVSIFVNPMQFGPTEDLASYPRDLAKDSALCESLGVDMIFHPEPEEMYHENFSSYVDMSVLTEELCGLSRPVHFRGVCTVVNKLFNIVQPDRAYFGQKDAQQLAIIKHMVEDLNMNVEILSKSINLGRKMVEDGETDTGVITKAMTDLINTEPLAKIDYVKAVDGITIRPVAKVKKPMLVAIAVYIGKTRLIDNFMI